MTRPRDIADFDPRRLADFAAGDREFMDDMVRMFLESAAAAVTDYGAAADSDHRRQLLHKLKGMALTVGAGRLADLCAAGGDNLTAALEAELLVLGSEMRHLQP